MSYIDKAYLTNNIFEIGNFSVDAKRGVIFNDTKSSSVEPKVMQVLLCLCQNPKQVVRQEEIFKEVWPKSIFNPNSLRRCIAELRKALDDNHKQIIATHPKIGYSINSDVEFKEQKPKLFEQKGKFEMVVGGLILATLFLLYLFPQTKTSNTTLSISSMQPVTATDAIEDFIALSSAEDKLAFTREVDKNKRAIWLKNLESGEEHNVNIAHQNIRNLAWGESNEDLYYVEVFNKGWAIWHLRLDSDNQVITQSKIIENNNSDWISTIRIFDSSLYYIVKIDGNFGLIKTSLKDLSKTTLLQSDAQFKPYDIAINEEKQLLAVSGQNKDNLAIVKLISLTTNSLGQESESFLLDTKQRFSIEYLPQNDSFSLNSGREIFQLNNEGEINKIDLEHYQFIRFVKPSKVSNNLYLISSKLDTDFALLAANSESVKSIVNSNGMDYFPSISPNNDHLAFYSTRFGLPQLFIKNLGTNKTKRVFANEKQHLNVEKSIWSPSGNELAFSVGYNIYLMETSFQEQPKLLSSKGRVLSWFPDGKHLLVLQTKSNTKTLKKVSTKDNSVEFLSNYDSGYPFIGESGNIYLVIENKLKRLNDSGVWQLHTTFEAKVKRTIRHQIATFIQFGDDTSWYHWSENKGVQKTSFEDKANSTIATISDDQSLAVSVSELRQNDILKLGYK